MAAPGLLIALRFRPRQRAAMEPPRLPEPARMPLPSYTTDRFWDDAQFYGTIFVLGLSTSVLFSSLSDAFFLVWKVMDDPVWAPYKVPFRIPSWIPFRISFKIEGSAMSFLALAVLLLCVAYFIISWTSEDVRVGVDEWEEADG